MNRLKDYFGDPPEPEGEHDDYFVIGTVRCAYAVTRDVAIEIERWLDHQPPPRWVVFKDLAGSRHRILAEHIHRVTESTAAQRAADRAFDRARRLEELFVLIDEALRRGDRNVEVRYNQALGYPVHFADGDQAADAPAWVLSDFAAR